MKLISATFATLVLGVCSLFFSAAAFGQSYQEQMAEYASWFQATADAASRGEIKRSEACRQATAKLNAITTESIWQRRAITQHLLFISNVELAAVKYEEGKMTPAEFSATYGREAATFRAAHDQLSEQATQAYQDDLAKSRAGAADAANQRAAAQRQQSNDFINGLILLNAARPQPPAPTLFNRSLNCTSRQFGNTVNTNCN